MSRSAKQLQIEEDPKTGEDLPEGWAPATLGVVVESMKNGLYKPATAYADHGIACLRMYNIEGGKIIWKAIKRMLLTTDEVKEYCLSSGDLLVNRVNSRELVGKTAVFPEGLEACVYESKNIRVRLISNLVNSHFVNYRLLLFGQRYFEYNAQQVVGMASISQPQIADFPIPLPPLVEQERIVNKIQQLLAELDSTRTRLSKVPLFLKHFRQAVLAAACSGKLTEDWRANQTHAESGKHLLDLLLVQRREQWEKLQRSRMTARGKHPLNDKWRGKYHDPAATLTPSEELPDNWAWVSVEQIAFVMSGNTPKGIERRAAPTGEIPWLKVGDMNQPGNERYMRNASSFLTQKDLEQLGLSSFPKGTFIFPKRGGAIATNKKRELLRESCIDLNTMAIVAMRDVKPFLWWWFSSVDLDGLSDGSNVPQINHSDINPLPVPLPPLQEQQEIVRRVDALFKLADAIEKRVQAATLRAERLTQAILAKAFRGELVPTEAELARRERREYEPASVLLERIKREREREREKNAATTVKPGKRARKS